jgi:thiosulfate/3-mercaptopyruvate sulfurtransferase
MNWGKMKTIFKIFILFTLLNSCNNQKKEIIKTSNPSKLISCEQISNIIKHNLPNYKIIDIRKKEDYLTGHIPGSINTWRPEYENRESEIKGIMASKNQMQSLLQKWGVMDNDTLILYDKSGNSNSCRLWWILKQYGFENTKILDGSYQKWQQLNLATDTIITQIKKSNLKLKEINLSHYANIADVQEHIMKNKVLLDSRTIEEFNGQVKKGNVKRGGHIPKAIRFDWSELVKIGDKEDGTFRDINIIKEKLDNIQIAPEDDIIVYCQSGVRSACVTFFLTELLRYNNVRNYDGSWLEWSNTDLEIESD